MKRLLICGMVITAFLFGQRLAFSKTDPAAPVKKGLWITCIGDANVLGSREAMERALQFAKRGGFNVLFVQVYRGDEAWFRSDIADAAPFLRNKAAVGQDSFELFIERAHATGIEVHAWINTLTLSKNSDAKFLKEAGPGILTKDQYHRNAIQTPKDKSENRFIREDQLFLEPGDWRVKARVKGIASELAGRYPALDGIHFDYIRYPAAVPYIPGSRFNKNGLSYGYGEANVKLFEKQNGPAIDVGALDGKRADSLVWDNWKRERLHLILQETVRDVRNIRSGIQISCAVLNAFDRGYLAAYQDWPLWIEEGLADFVVLMNYSTDSRYVRLSNRSALGLVDRPGRVWAGLGAFLMKDNPGLLYEQVLQTRRAGGGGIVFFDYDTLLENSVLDDRIRSAFNAK